MSDLKNTPIFNFINPVFNKNNVEDNTESSINTHLLENNLEYSHNFYYILSIISFLFCFPLGAYSIYYCYKAKKLYNLRLDEQANKLIKFSYWLSICSIVFGLLIYLYLYCSIKINEL